MILSLARWTSIVESTFQSINYLYTQTHIFHHFPYLVRPFLAQEYLQKGLEEASLSAGEETLRDSWPSSPSFPESEGWGSEGRGKEKWSAAATTSARESPRGPQGDPLGPKDGTVGMVWSNDMGIHQVKSADKMMWSMDSCVVNGSVGHNTKPQMNYTLSVTSPHELLAILIDTVDLR